MNQFTLLKHSPTTATDGTTMEQLNTLEEKFFKEFEKAKWIQSGKVLLGGDTDGYNVAYAKAAARVCLDEMKRAVDQIAIIGIEPMAPDEWVMGDKILSTDEVIKLIKTY